MMEIKPTIRKRILIPHPVRLLLAILLALGGMLLLLSCATVAESSGGQVSILPSPTPPPPATDTVTPTPSSTMTPTPTPTETPTSTPTLTDTPTETATATATPAPTSTTSSTMTPAPAEPQVPETPSTTPVYSYKIVNIYPHRRDAYTQGLIYHDGVLYEGTGYWNQSSLRRVTLETGVVEQIQPLGGGYFGEGITLYDDRIFQLTWLPVSPYTLTHGFVYDLNFTELYTLTYATQGWGLTHDGTRLIMSDGTSTLYFRDPETFDVTGQVQVYDELGLVTRLNELEYIDGQVYANVYQTDRVAIIDPQTGQVTAWIDLSGLLEPEEYLEADVLNGIAYDAAADRLFVTGKWWPWLFEIELVVTQAYLPLVQTGPGAAMAEAGARIARRGMPVPW